MPRSGRVTEVVENSLSVLLARLDTLYLRVVAPTSAALLSTSLLVGFLALFSGAAALVLAACLVGAGVALPLAGRGGGWWRSVPSCEALRGETVRGLCSVVGQQTHLFNTSIRENLRLARPDAADDELLRALRRAHLEDDVAALPDGLSTVVGENGARFPGGQARRPAIARAFLRDAPILLLDKPTEGLDPASELAVLDGLAMLMRSRTTILITHRPRALAGLFH